MPSPHRGASEHWLQLQRPYFDWETVQLSDADLAKAFGPAAVAPNGPAGSAGSAGPPGPAGAKQCKVFPGDAAWPSDSVWASFNASVGGALIKTVPLAAPCYKNWPQYDAAKCAQIEANWHDPHLQ